MHAMAAYFHFFYVSCAIANWIPIPESLALGQKKHSLEAQTVSSGYINVDTFFSDQYLYLWWYL